MRFGGSLTRIRQSFRYYRGSSVITDETKLGESLFPEPKEASQTDLKVKFDDDNIDKILDDVFSIKDKTLFEIMRSHKESLGKGQLTFFTFFLLKRCLKELFN